jgi:O-antigen ligase
MIPADVYRRVLDPQNYTYEQSGTLRIRMKLWGVGVEVAKDKWLTGTGIGNQALVPLYIKDPVPDRISLHCEYLETFVEVGLFGSLAFLGFVGLMARRARQAAQLFRKIGKATEQYWLMIAIQLTMLAVLLDGVQVDVFHFPLKGWWLVAGLTWAMWKQAHTALADVSLAKVMM